MITKLDRLTFFFATTNFFMFIFALLNDYDFIKYTMPAPFAYLYGISLGGFFVGLIISSWAAKEQRVRVTNG